jgi:putative chitinase
MATKKIPKIKQQKRKDFKELLKQNSELKALVEAPKTFKKVLVKPIKDTKEFSKNFKQGVKDQVVNEVPILGLLFGDKKKKNKQKKTKKNSINTLNKILKEIQLISAGMKGGSKKGSETTKEETTDQEEKEPVQENKTQVSGGTAAGLAAVVGTIGVGVMYLFSKKSEQPAEQVPESRIPSPILETGNQQQDEQTAQIVSETDPSALIDGIESKYKNLPKKAEETAKDVEDKKNKLKDAEKTQKEEEEKRRKEQLQKQTEEPRRQTQPTAPAPLPAPTPAPAVENKPVATATQPQPKPQAATTPGAVQTGSGGQLVDIEGKAIVAPAIVEQKPTPAPMPRPTPAPTAAPAPLPAPTPAPSAPVAEQRPKPTITPAPVPPPPAVREQQKPMAPSGKPAKPGFEAGKIAMIQAMNEAGIRDPMARAQMVAQAAHESGKFNYTSELGKDEYFKKYEGRKDLGNTQEGDGIKFKGRGFLQTTGRANYEDFSKAFGVDAVSNPGLLAADATAAAKSALFWFKKNANTVKFRMKEAGTPGDWTNTKAVTRAVNGGYNGLEERIHYFEMFKNDKSITGVSEEVAARIADSNIVKNTLLVKQKENINIRRQ